MEWLSLEFISILHKVVFVEGLASGGARGDVDVEEALLLRLVVGDGELVVEVERVRQRLEEGVGGADEHVLDGLPEGV